MPGNCRADELSRAGELLPETSSIELVMPLASGKLDIRRKFFPDANLSWVNKEYCSTVRLTWPWMDRRQTITWYWSWRYINHSGYAYRSLRYGKTREDTLREWGAHLTTSAVNADPLRKRRLLSNFFVSARLLTAVDIGYLAPHSLTELLSIDIRDIASYIKLSGWFTCV